MKKLLFSAFALFIAIGFSVSTTSCKKGGDSDSTEAEKAALKDFKANLKTKTDSLSYAFGMTSSNGLDQYLEQLGVDTTNMDQFYQGLVDAVNSVKDKKKNAYFAGACIGNQLYNNMVRSANANLSGDPKQEVLDIKNVVAGFIDGLKSQGAMSPEQAYEVQQRIGMELQQQLTAKNGEENKKKGEAYLAENKKKEGVVTLPSGVQYKVLKQGSGKTPSADSEITINYEGKLIDGTVFDSSYTRGEPITCPANAFIPGFNEAISHMTPGSKWEVVIPQELAYGEHQAGEIPAYSTLIFTIELISIK